MFELRLDQFLFILLFTGLFLYFFTLLCQKIQRLFSHWYYQRKNITCRLCGYKFRIKDTRQEVFPCPHCDALNERGKSKRL